MPEDKGRPAGCVNDRSQVLDLTNGLVDLCVAAVAAAAPVVDVGGEVVLQGGGKRLARSHAAGAKGAVDKDEGRPRPQSA